MSALYVRSGCICLLIICFACRKEIQTKTSVSAVAVSSAVENLQPNILFIIGDDIGYEVPACDGGESYTTPNINELARKGMCFTECHSSPMCSPSRISLLTGKYNFRNYTEWGHLDTDNKTVGNMLKNAGYATCYTGKWQLDGGNTSVKAFGWQKYSVWLPFLMNEVLEGSRYKSPKVYQDGEYIPSKSTLNKYADDIFTTYLLNFIDSVHSLDKPFFAYYAMNLCHKPFVPTPDDPEYGRWNFDNSDKTFFPSMVRYMDKKIGQIISHLQTEGLLNNTLIIYAGDNGTPKGITSQYNAIMVDGGKQSTDEPGTNVPLIARWDGKITPAAVSNILIDFTDFLPTLADAANIDKPMDYGILDGKSFYPTLIHNAPGERSYIYNAYSVDGPLKDPFIRWVQNDDYKLYDTGSFTNAGKLLKIKKCRPDGLPIPYAELTPEEKILRKNFQEVLNAYH